MQFCQKFLFEIHNFNPATERIHYHMLLYTYQRTIKKGKIQKFKSKGKKKQILLLMNDNYDKVKNFLSSNKINLSKMEDLVKVVEFYNNI